MNKQTYTRTRTATFEDMQASRVFQLNMYSAMLEPDFDGEVGFTYFDRHGFVTLDQETGAFNVDVMNMPASFTNLEEAEQYLWRTFLRGESLPITEQVSELDLLKDEYDHFILTTGLPAMSADELLLETKADSDAYRVTGWHRNYLSDFVNRWQIAEDLSGETGRLPE